MSKSASRVASGQRAWAALSPADKAKRLAMLAKFRFKKGSKPPARTGAAKRKQVKRKMQAVSDATRELRQGISIGEIPIEGAESGVVTGASSGGSHHSGHRRRKMPSKGRRLGRKARAAAIRNLKKARRARGGKKSSHRRRRHRSPVNPQNPSFEFVRQEGMGKQIGHAPGKVCETPIDTLVFVGANMLKCSVHKPLWSWMPKMRVFADFKVRRHGEASGGNLPLDWKRPYSNECLDENGDPKLREKFDGKTVMEMRGGSARQPYKPEFSEDIVRGY